jgi:hypothetical protein
MKIEKTYIYSLPSARPFGQASAAHLARSPPSARPCALRGPSRARSSLARAARPAASHAPRPGSLASTCSPVCSPAPCFPVARRAAQPARHVVCPVASALARLCSSYAWAPPTSPPTSCSSSPKPPPTHLSLAGSIWSLITLFPSPSHAPTPLLPSRPCSCAHPVDTRPP